MVAGGDECARGPLSEEFLQLDIEVEVESDPVLNGRNAFDKVETRLTTGWVGVFLREVCRISSPGAVLECVLGEEVFQQLGRDPHKVPFCDDSDEMTFLCDHGQTADPLFSHHGQGFQGRGLG